MGICSTAQKSAKIYVPVDGVFNIPKEDGIKLVRDLFKDIGLNRLRAVSYFSNLTFSDVDELDCNDLTEAVAIGLDYATDPQPEDFEVNYALLKRLEAQFPHPRGHFVYRVGCSCKMAWPNDRTLMGWPICCKP